MSLAQPIASLGVLIFIFAMIWAAIRDLVSFRIPNAIPIAVTAAFLISALALAMEPSILLRHLAAGIVVLMICFGLFMRGYIGGGDAKLLGSVAAWTGWSLLPAYLLAVALIGGVLALVLIVFRRLPLHRRLASVAWLSRLHAKNGHVPYGVAIGGGALLSIPQFPAVIAISSM